MQTKRENAVAEILRFRAGFAVLVVGAAIGAFAVGCGGGDDDGTTGAAAGVASSEAGEEGAGEAGTGTEGNGEESGGAESSGGDGGEGGESASGEGASGGSGAGGGSSQSGSVKGGGSVGGGSGKKKKGKGSAGGDGSGGSAGGNGPKTRFIEEADAICVKWGKTVQTDAQKGYSGDLNGSKSQVKEGINSLVEAVEKYVVGDLEAELSGIRALNAPAEAEEAKAVALSAIEKLVDEAKADPEGLVLGTGKTTKESEALTKAQGFTACGNLVGQLA